MNKENTHDAMSQFPENIYASCSEMDSRTIFTNSIPEHVYFEKNQQCKPDYKYNEDKVLKEVTEYIAGTYGGHYVGEDNVQALDIWKSLGTFDSSCRDTSIKYLMRFGKKEGKNRKDLLKALHYIILILGDLEKENGKKNKND